MDVLCNSVGRSRNHYAAEKQQRILFVFLLLLLLLLSYTLLPLHKILSVTQHCSYGKFC
jgi:hypothetical protein